VWWLRLPPGLVASADNNLQVWKAAGNDGKTVAIDINTEACEVAEETPYVST
jgi:hypothetical protein